MSDDPPPLLNNRFSVDISGHGSSESRTNVAFVSIKGICSRHSVRPTITSLLRPGSYLFKKPRFHRIKLCRALGTDHFFYDWHIANLDRPQDLRTLTITQLEQSDGKILNRWQLIDCWVHTWSGPEFNAINTDIAYESMTICYRYLKWLPDSGSANDLKNSG